MLRSTWWVTSLLLVPVVRGPAAQSKAETLVSADREAARASSSSGFSGAARTALGDSGILLWPGAPVLAGRAELEKFFSQSSVDSLHLSWQPLGLTLSPDSTVGVTWGVAARPSASANLPPRLGRYLAVWSRTVDRWAIAALAFIGVEDPDLPPQVWRGLSLTRSAARARARTAPFVTADLAFARLAADSGAAVAFAKYAAEEAMSFGGPGLLVRGPDAISRAVSGPAHWTWQPVSAGASGDGLFGWTVGEAVISDGGRANYSKYLTAWTRTPDGRVLFVYDGGNARPRPR